MKTSNLIFSLVSLLMLFPVLGYADVSDKPSTSERVIEFFNTNDIEVQIYPPVFPVMVGELNFYGKLDEFWNVLELKKEDIARRAKGIETLIVSTYTTAHLENSMLTLDVNLDEQTLERYLSLFEIKAEIKRTINVEIRTSSIDLHSPDEEEFKKLSEIMEFLVSRRNQINDLSGIIREIDVTGGSEYLLLEYGKMNLPENNYHEAFDRYSGLLKRAAGVFKPQETHNLEVRLGFDLEREDEKEEFNRVVEALEINEKAVEKLFESDRVRKIRIDYKREDNRYNRLKRELRLASRGAGIEIMSSLLPTIASELSLVKDIGIEISSSNDEMNGDYQRGISKIESFKNEILSKANFIDEIRLTTYRRTRFRSGILFINPREDDHYLTDALNEVQ